MKRSKKKAAPFEYEVRASLLHELRKVVLKNNLTHKQVADATGISRSRITSILSAKLDYVSADLLIKILGSLGYKVSLSISDIWQLRRVRGQSGMKRQRKKPMQVAISPRRLLKLMELAMEQAARKVREENKRWGEPLIVWENGKVVRIPPDKY